MSNPLLKESQGATGSAYAHTRQDAHGKVTADTHLGEFKGPHQETTDPWTVTADDVKFPMLKDGDYIDSLSMLGVTPAGEVFLCQLLVTNLGLSARVGVQFKWTDATGVVQFLKDEHALTKLKIDESGLAWEVNETHRFSWDPETSTGRAVINHSKSGVKADIEFKSDGGGYKIGNGLVSFGAKKFQFLAYPAPRALVSGSVEFKGAARDITGTTGFVSHAFQNMKAHHIACRWHMVKFHAHGANLTCNINVGVSPHSSGHVPMCNGALVRDGKMVICGTDAIVDMDGLEVDKASGYPVPKTVCYELRGTNSEGKKVSITMPVVKTKVVERLDILSALPWVLRTLIKTFIAKPYFYVMINEIEATVSVEGGEEEKVRGHLVHEIMHLAAQSEYPTGEVRRAKEAKEAGEKKADSTSSDAAVAAAPAVPEETEPEPAKENSADAEEPKKEEKEEGKAEPKEEDSTKAEDTPAE